MVKEVPVYLFLGFLDAGKTKFIQETLEDERFESGEKTLVLVLEEGETEFDPSRFRIKDFHIEALSMQEASVERLTQISHEYGADRVVAECNGMTPLNDFFEIMPDGWMIAQVMTFFDSSTFTAYNQNIRQLTFDKIQYADLVVFNRFKEEYSKAEFHKIVRGISRRPDIVYEFMGGRAEYDEIVDPLPYDINADVISIEDRDYAFFYRDLMENMQNYDGKTVCFKGLVATDRKLKNGTIVVGRHIMTCCEADIAYSGLVVKHTSDLPLKTRDWIVLTAKISVESDKIYDGNGPVLKAEKLSYSTPPEQELATFY